MEKENKTRHHMRAFYDAMAKNKAKNFIIFVLLLTTLFGAYQYSRALRLKRELNNVYNRAFYDLVGYVQNVEVMLMKTMMTSSPELTTATLRDVWREADSAANNLSQLPVSVGVLSNTQKFLSQVSDLSQTMSRQTTMGNTIDDEQMKTLESLHTFSLDLRDSLDELKNDLSNGNFKWENVMQEGTKTFNQTSQQMPGSFETIDQGFQEMPTLIYDGPFSEHMQNIKALGLSGNQVTEDQAIESMSKFIGKDKLRNVRKLSDNNNGIIDTYNFRIELDGKENDSVAEADVSRIGGRVVWYLHNRAVDKVTVGIEKAKETGRKFLEDHGYPDMKDTYYIENGGIATINYACTKNGVTYYPDLIKVQIALDNGEVAGFEASGYLMNHRDRNLGAPQLTEAQAREKVIRGDNVRASGLAVIPTDYGTELYCYEFIGKLNDKDFIVYINANTGAEEEVLLIINTEEGILTM